MGKPVKRKISTAARVSVHQARLWRKAEIAHKFKSLGYAKTVVEHLRPAIANRNRAMLSKSLNEVESSLRSAKKEAGKAFNSRERARAHIGEGKRATEKKYPNAKRGRRHRPGF